MGLGASKAEATTTEAAAAPPPPPTAAPKAPSSSPAGPVIAMDMTLAQLKEYAGTDADKPLLLALDGVIYDVSESRSFYGPGGPYAVFAGRECARALAFMKIDEESCTDDVAGATEAQLKTLADWKKKFDVKYRVVGKVLRA